MAQEGLGRLFNARVSTTTAALTVGLKDAAAVTIFGTGTSTNDITFTQRTGPDGTGSSAALHIDHYYTQTNGVWTRVAVGAADVTDGVFAINATLWAVEVFGTQLDDGFTYVAASCSSGTFFLVQHDLVAQRAPASLADIRA
jgi:hypothetical protein